MRALRDAGLDSIQLSFQSDESSLADEIAGARAHERKLDVAAKIRAAGISLSLNFVIHRRNIDRLPQIIDLAEALGAERVELANVQFYGWAFRNRAALLPTREQVDRARDIATAAKARLAGKIDIFYVLPDYYETRPKPCLNGWGQRYLTVNPTRRRAPLPDCFIRHSRFAFRKCATHAISIGSGANQKASTDSVERNGCRSRAGVVRKEKSISAVAVVRPRC